MIAGALIGYASATFLNTENYGSYQNTLQKKRIASPTEEYINEVVKLIQADVPKVARLLEGGTAGLDKGKRIVLKKIEISDNLERTYSTGIVDEKTIQLKKFIRKANQQKFNANK